jgi:FdhD protein
VKPASTRQALRYEAGRWSVVARQIPEETPLAIVCNGSAFASVLATPADLEDLAYGFALTEGIVDNPADISGLTIHAVDEGHEARLTIPAAKADALQDRRRAFAARTSCSLCGLEHLDALLAAAPALGSDTVRYAPEILLAAIAALPKAQRLNAQTRAVHAAGWIDASGQLVAIREDIGRHNALDKLIGALIRAGQDISSGAVCLTSRCSVEMVLKSAKAGAPVIAAASSPTELAVRAAEAAGLTLAAALRGEGFDVYAHADRIKGAPQ